MIAYLRCSTQKQGQSGLGLEAQRALVSAYPIDEEFVEVETGKRIGLVDLDCPIWKLIEHRPQLRCAIEAAVARKTKLVIAKLDRLARDVAFTACLQASGVEFICADNPHVTSLTIHILAAVAQEESRLISVRTKEALAARRARGLPMGANVKGCKNLTKKARDMGRARAIEVVAQRTHRRYQALYPRVCELRAQGLSWRKVSKEVGMTHPNLLVSLKKYLPESQLRPIMLAT